jgi:hypothetical protein
MITAKYDLNVSDAQLFIFVLNFTKLLHFVVYLQCFCVFSSENEKSIN